MSVHSHEVTISGHARCPYMLFRNVLGSRTVLDLLAYVTAHEDGFTAARVRNRHSGERRIDHSRRDCLSLAGVGPFERPFKAFVNSVLDVMLKELRLHEAVGEPAEFEFSSYGDGGHFATHIDTGDRVRVLSCVYYFAATPRPFTGGELRLHGFPGSPLSATSAPFVDIAPETDTLVAFPSWLPHEVLPVQAPSGAWGDRRFAINCWVSRAQPLATAPR